ncbi:MAG: hypothetical protein LBI31_07235 [Zoogloeaceae bacterium]|jgi:hypothetical protein|nr:hypothetical protein [Zoogloeaceae bacterium]
MRSSLLHRLRHHSGIRASKLVIRPSAIGYAQIAMGAAGALLFFLLWYGIHVMTRSPEEQNIVALQERIDQLETTLHESGSMLTNLEMTRSANRGLEEELRSVSSDLAVVKDDLAYFLQLVPVGTREGEVRLERLSVRSDPSAMGQYRFSVLVGYHAGRQTTGFTGRLQFRLTLERDGRLVRMNWPDDREAMTRPDFRVQTHQWVRKEGVIILSPGDVLKKAEILLLQGSIQRAAASVTF